MVDISICMVAYNHREYICQAIDSILAQETDYTYEIIVNDDAIDSSSFRFEFPTFSHDV